jgi:hypothetical protein
MVSLSTGGVSEKERFANIRSRAAELGVLDINFSGGKRADSPERYEKALEIIAENKNLFDSNAGEGPA